MYHRVWVILLAIGISGCATQGVSIHQYNEPQQLKVENEVVIAKGQSDSWDTLVKQLSKSFYVINNIDKASRIINVSFSSNSPGDYIDCGKAHRTYAQGEKNEVYDYDTANPSRYRAATPRRPNRNFAYYINVNRETGLEGRSNIYVAPEEKNPNNTVVTVNTRYIWSVKARGVVVVENSGGTIINSQILPEQTYTVTFNTGQSGYYTENTGERVTCVSKGTLERQILNMVTSGAN